MKAKLPLKSLIGGVLVAVSTTVCAWVYVQAESSTGSESQTPVLVENQSSL